MHLAAVAAVCTGKTSLSECLMQIPSMNTLSEQHLKQLQDSSDTAQRDYQEATNAATLAQQAVKHSMTLATKRLEELQGQRTIKAATGIYLIGC